MNNLFEVDDASWESVVAEHEVVLIDAYATWCGPCRMFAPVLERASGETGIPIYSVDIDANPEFTRIHQIQSIPTVVVYQNGELAGRFSGAMPYPRLLDTLQTYVVE